MGESEQSPPRSWPGSIRVMHLTDSLAMGGTERVAVNLVNTLPRNQYQPSLCMTRCSGPLADLVAPDVACLDLARTSRFDLKAIRKLVDYIQRNKIQILHAHSSSLLVANIAARVKPFPKIIWHDHFGRYQVERRSVWIYRLLTLRAAGVIAVNQPLADWSRQQLRLRADRVWYLPNFPCSGEGNEVPSDLPGTPNHRIVCVANLRPEKDHLTLVNAMRHVVNQCPNAHLLLVGSHDNEAHVRKIQDRIHQQQLDKNVHLLGSRRDVSDLLRVCDIGVLSSASEGLPLSLLEYGLAGLPAIATDVGQCREVLEYGECGSVVPSGSVEQLAQALIKYLESPEYRHAIARKFQQRVHKHYSPDAAIEKLSVIYRLVLAEQKSNTGRES